MSIKGKSKIQHKAAKGRLRDNGQRRKILNRVFPNQISKKGKNPQNEEWLLKANRITFLRKDIPVPMPLISFLLAEWAQSHLFLPRQLRRTSQITKSMCRQDVCFRIINNWKHWRRYIAFIHFLNFLPILPLVSKFLLNLCSSKMDSN